MKTSRVGWFPLATDKPFQKGRTPTSVAAPARTSENLEVLDPPTATNAWGRLVKILPRPRVVPVFVGRLLTSEGIEVIIFIGGCRRESFFPSLTTWKRGEL